MRTSEVTVIFGEISKSQPRISPSLIAMFSESIVPAHSQLNGVNRSYYDCCFSQRAFSEEV
jgi:hypothetical protein